MIGNIGIPPNGMIGAPPMGMIGMGGGMRGIGGGPPPMPMGGGMRGIGGGPPPMPMGGGIYGMGGVPMGIMGGGIQGNTPSTPISLKPGDSIMVAIEVKEKDITLRPIIDLRKNDTLVKHKWGGSVVLYQDQSEIYVQGYKLPTPAEQYQRQLARLKRNPEELLKMAQWCLTVGLVDECMKTCDDLGKMLEGGKGKDVPEKVTNAWAAYSKVKPEFVRGVSKMPTATLWKERLGADFSITSNEFYAILHNNEPGMRESVQRRLKLLDFTFKNFYLWHALKGKALPTPSEKLVAILEDTEDEFNKRKVTFDAGDLNSDGFFARRDNLAVFVNQRLDLGSRNFQSKIAALKVYKRADLLKGSFPAEAKDIKQRQAAARAAMLFVVDQALQEEGEIASTTHEGTRQLFAATGLLPRNVEIPQWVQFGLASIFEMPKGPFPGDFSQLKVALWPGVGAPSWAYMGHFTELDRKGDLPGPYDTMVDTVTDEFFILAHEGLKSKKDRLKPSEIEKLDQIKEALLIRAKTLSWALTYYVANEKLDDLHKYFQELGKLPREMELNETAKQLAFAKAFGLTKPTLVGDTFDRGRFLAFSSAWLDHMKTLRSPTADLKLDEVKDDGPTGTTPDPMGGPGGPPPGPGPGPGPGGLGGKN